jgi:hypothetical protein
LEPGYQSNFTHIVLAQDLYEDSAQGDEPEPLEVVKHKLSDLEELVYNQDFQNIRKSSILYHHLALEQPKQHRLHLALSAHIGVFRR